jgi:hypothetical protein
MNWKGYGIKMLWNFLPRQATKNNVQDVRYLTDSKQALTIHESVALLLVPASPVQVCITAAHNYFKYF